MTGWLLFLSILAVVAAFFAILVTVGTALRLRQLEAQLLPAQMGLAPGSEAPKDILSSTSSSSVNTLLLGPTVLIFASPTCEPCRSLVDWLNLNGDRFEEAGAHLLFVEPADGSGSLHDRVRIPAEWLLDTDSRIRSAFKTNASPHTFLIRQGRIYSQLLGADLEPLMERLRDPGTVDQALAATR